MELYIILGYLGSGKTTYVSHFLNKLGGKKTALIVNDFGEVDVDGKILERYTPFTLAGGSMFCSCKSDQFVKIASEIADMDFDNIVVESSGFSNPYNLRELIELVNKRAKNPLELIETVTVVDAKNCEKIISTLNMTKVQIAFADVVLINKCDTVEESDVERVESLVREFSPNARIERTINGQRRNFEIRNVEKQAVKNVLDLNMQKQVIVVDNNVSFEQLEKFCEQASTLCHRIKGGVTVSNFSGIFQYSFSEKKKTEGKTNNKLVFLTFSKKSLKKFLIELLKENDIGKLDA